MLTGDGEIIVSSDVTFAGNAMEPIEGAVAYTNTEAWLATLLTQFAVPGGVSAAVPTDGSGGSVPASLSDATSTSGPRAVNPPTTVAPPRTDAPASALPGASAGGLGGSGQPAAEPRLSGGNGAEGNGVFCDASDNGANLSVAPLDPPARPPTARAVSVSQREQRAVARRSRMAHRLRDAAAGARSDEPAPALPRTILPAASNGATFGADESTNAAM